MPKWPAYENTVRVWGFVRTIFDTTQNGARLVVAVILDVTDSSLGEHVDVRVEGGPAAMDLGIGEFAVGDSMLVSGHLAPRLSCHHDDIDNIVIPNVFWKCNGGTCVQVTP